MCRHRVFEALSDRFSFGSCITEPTQQPAGLPHIVAHFEITRRNQSQPHSDHVFIEQGFVEILCPRFLMLPGGVRTEWCRCHRRGRDICVAACSLCMEDRRRDCLKTAVIVLDNVNSHGIQGRWIASQRTSIRGKRHDLGRACHEPLPHGQKN